MSSSPVLVIDDDIEDSAATVATLMDARGT